MILKNGASQVKAVDVTMIQNLQVQVKELQSKNKNLKSKVFDCTMCQNLQVQVEELKSVNESLNLSVEELYKARALAEATLRERDQLISDQCKKMRLLEECESFCEVHSKFDSEIVLDTQDNSEKDLILSFQTQVKETAKLVVVKMIDVVCPDIISLCLLLLTDLDTRSTLVSKSQDLFTIGDESG
ncbi:hypothetical protein Tco_1362945 [Tanacetum coccineum]